MNNPVIWRLTRWVRRTQPRLKFVSHGYCVKADEAHKADRRLYAHTHHHKDFPWVICWAQAVNRLQPNTVAGICIHEFGHLLAGNRRSEEDAEMAADVAAQALLDPLGVQLRYRGVTVLQWVNFTKMLQRGLEHA